MDRFNLGSEPIKAYVVLKEPTHSPAAAVAGPTSGIERPALRRYESDDLRQQLERMGFYVKRVTPLSIIVEAPRETFEGVFRGKLGREDVASVSSRWHWTGTVRIPDELSERVDTVLFPEPTRLHI